MNKKAYRNKRLEKLNTEYNLNLPGQGLADGSLSVGRGYAMPGEPTTPAIHSDHEDEEEFPKRVMRKQNLDYDDLTDLFICLSDEMDKKALYDFSDFSDFLIKKIAQQNVVDYQILLKEMVMKINNSDIVNKYDFIISLIKEYNSILVELSVDSKEKTAHKEAYQMVATMAANYV